ncbi:hypothetical protein ABZX92_29790 [Lentzea sp. NPDC006480]|uniref:WXG100 family type VII secretion target n=1 Tax=Lentzea sp. NPDC006480 TaxID=3157176 RepID=UPI0033B07D08
MNSSVAAEIMDSNTRIRAELDSLNSDLVQSLASWQTPESRRAYNENKVRWDNAANSMPVSLQIGSEILTGITDRMGRTEAAIADSWS